MVVMITKSADALERVRSVSFAILSIVSVGALLGNVILNPTTNNLSCNITHSNLDALLTIGLWILAIAASLGALSATHHQLQPPERYKRWLVWLIYAASIPALLLLPSSLSINGAVSACATSIFFTYLTWYMMGVIAAAALCCIHILINGVKHQEQRADNLAITAGTANAHLQHSNTNHNSQLVTTIKQLRTPLTNLRVQIESLLATDTPTDTEQAKAALLKINDAAGMMAVTLETHLDLAKAESGSLELNLIDLNLRDMVEHICDELRPVILKQSLILLLRTNLTSQSIVQADRTKIHQILRTLILHAQENTSRGTITAFVRDDADKKTIHVDILDTGTGMNSDDLGTLFTTHASSNSTSNSDTSNLKLCLAQKLAEAMRGTITAHSNGKGKGSRFTLTLPLEM
jgi:signal transduction histidine kinase